MKLETCHELPKTFDKEGYESLEFTEIGAFTEPKQVVKVTAKKKSNKTPKIKGSVE